MKDFFHMAISDLGHIALACANLNASLAFYAKLGINEAFRLKRDDGSTILVYLHISGDRFLELFPGGPDAETRASGATSTFRHVCLASDDLAADVASLREQGVTIDRDISIGLDANQQAWLTDPDGNAWIIQERGHANA
jgi:catechol 2,3-dioxygenase-like lactoylglutathione lyase family enzyme